MICKPLMLCSPIGQAPRTVPYDRRRVLAPLLLTLAAGTACECDDCNGFLLFDNAYVEASVVRAADASPVAGAVVRVSRDSVALLEGTTGADGVVLLTIVMSSDSVPIVVGVVPPPPLLEGPPQTATLRSGDTARFTFSLAAAAR